MTKNPVVVETFQLLERAGSAAYVIGDSDVYIILLRCRFVRLVSEHGLTDAAASAFASFANVLMHQYGDISTAVELAELSLAIQEILPSQFYKARTLLTANVYVLYWVRPLSLRVRHIHEAYVSGMDSGNRTSAFNALGCFLYAEFAAGTNLFCR
mmetsp:Transcript_10758/g.20722  ORF Transcript_10758/g.20722 Transcript_10758/m.20722 type:complete len:155 (+) Transcript_10758:2142-2606(+)|eukprot:scaffold310_cov168-Amphora_coffeaeformis.AAC.13